MAQRQAAARLRRAGWLGLTVAALCAGCARDRDGPELQGGAPPGLRAEPDAAHPAAAHPAAAHPEEAPAEWAQRLAFRQQVIESLDNMDEVLDRLHARAVREPGAERVELEATLAAIEQQRQDLRRALAQVAGVPREAWDAVRAEVARGAERVALAFEQAYDRYLRDEPEETYRLANGFVWARREDYRIAAETAMVALDRKVARLRVWAEATQRPELAPVLGDLELRKETVRASLDRFAATPEEAWPPFQAEVRASLDSLRSAIDAAWRTWSQGLDAGPPPPAGEALQ